MGSLTIKLKRYGLLVFKEYKPKLFVKHKCKKIFGAPLDLKIRKALTKRCAGTVLAEAFDSSMR